MNTILIIEDNLDVADNIACILQLAHYNVLSAPNGKVGVEIAQQKIPDLIICDVMMPELDGYGVLHILRNDALTAGIPFIFLTAKTDRSDLRHGMNLGADDYLTKPFEASDLLKVIEARVKRNELLKSNRNNPNDVSEFFTNARSNADLEKISLNKPVRTFRKKDFIFMEGQSPNDLYFIKTGKVKTLKINNEGKELITGIHQTGDFLGYGPLLEDKPYNEGAEALEETEIAVISKHDFISIVYSSKDIAKKFIKMLSNNLADMENRLLGIAYQSVRQRVAGSLLRAADYGKSSIKSEVISIARRDLSNIIGTATESLNRTLADFRDEGLIEILDDGIKILSRLKLEKLSR